MAVSSTRSAIWNSFTRSSTAFHEERMTMGERAVVSITRSSATPSSPTL